MVPTINRTVVVGAERFTYSKGFRGKQYITKISTFSFWSNNNRSISVNVPDVCTTYTFV